MKRWYSATENLFKGLKFDAYVTTQTHIQNYWKHLQATVCLMKNANDFLWLVVLS